MVKFRHQLAWKCCIWAPVYLFFVNWIEILRLRLFCVEQPHYFISSKMMYEVVWTLYEVVWSRYTIFRRRKSIETEANSKIRGALALSIPVLWRIIYRESLHWVRLSRFSAPKTCIFCSKFRPSAENWREKWYPDGWVPPESFQTQFEHSIVGSGSRRHGLHSPSCPNTGVSEAPFRRKLHTEIKQF